MPRDSVKANNQPSKQVRSWILASVLILAMGGIVLPAVGADLFTSTPTPVMASLNPLTFDAPATVHQDQEAAAKATKKEIASKPETMAQVELSEWQWTFTAPKTVAKIVTKALAAGKTINNPALLNYIAQNPISPHK